MARLTRPELERLIATIAQSPIIVKGPWTAKLPARLARLPDGFEDIDLAILDWIAAEARRIGNIARI